MSWILHSYVVYKWLSFSFRSQRSWSPSMPELKAQIEELKNQKQQLVYMLNLHRPTCIVRAQNGQTPEDERKLFIQQIKETTLQGLNLTISGTMHTSIPTSCVHL